MAHSAPLEMLGDYLDSFDTIERLDAWAKVWHLSNHEEVVKKRKTLSRSTTPPLKGDAFNIIARPTKRFKNTMTETVYVIKFNEGLLDKTLIELYDQLESMFDKVLAMIAGNDSDLVRIYINHPDLIAPILYPPTPYGRLLSRNIMAEVSRVLQSAENLRLTSSMTIHVGLLNMREAGRGCRLADVHLHKGCLFAKRSILSMASYPKDNLCASRAFTLALAYNRREESDFRMKHYRQLRRNKKLLTRDACSLHIKAGLQKNQTVALSHFPRFEQELQTQAVIFSSHNLIKPIYVGMNYPRRVYLFLDERKKIGHYHPITSVQGFQAAGYYCEGCFQSFNTKGKHVCRAWCKSCHRGNCAQSGCGSYCSVCGQYCRSPSCLFYHQKESSHGNPSICDSYTYCSKCHRGGSRKDFLPHRCGMNRCNRCEKKLVTPWHDCYMRSLRKYKMCDKFIFFDFESVQEGGTHTPNMVVIQTRCSDCLSKEDAAKCDRCGTRCPDCDEWLYASKKYKINTPCRKGSCADTEVVYHGENTVASFCNWLLTEKRSRSTVIAHNSSGYDSLFILRALLLDYCLTPKKIIYRGSKLLYMVVPGYEIRFIDSYCFLSIPLANFPKAMGFSNEEKGYFPYLFNTWYNSGYTGERPHHSYYHPETMSVDRKKKFLSWYDSVKDVRYDHDEELLRYCRNDVTILRKGCLRFRQEYLDGTGLDPFSFVTIAGVCMADYRYRFLTEDHLVLTKKAKKENGDWQFARWKKDCYTLKNGDILTPNDVAEHRFIRSPIGIVRNDEGAYSKKAIAWLSWMEEQYRRAGLNVKIQHALRGGEKRISTSEGTYRVDGFANIQGKDTVFSFHGCFYHGCEECFPPERKKKYKKKKTIR